MLRFQGGDKQAFGKLVQRNTERIHALVYRFLGDPDQVDDLTQEAFLRVYRTAPRYKPTAKFGTWLYRIVANLSHNVVRAQHRRYVRSLEASLGEDGQLEDSDYEDHNGSPLASLGADELAREVADAVKALPPNQRAAVVLNEYDQKNYAEIAEVLGCSSTAVKSTLYRARTKLRNSLSHYLQD